MSQVPADLVLQFSKVISSSLDEDTRALQYNVPGIGDMEAVEGGGARINDDDNQGEGSSAEVFGALGIIGRPLPPETVKGQELHAEVACVRQADGLIPIAMRDLRLKMQGSGPNEGTLAFVGYGGGFHSLSPVDGGAGGTVHVLYCPYDFDSSGVARKAHSFTMDPSPGNESMMLVHADGQAIILFEKKVVLKSPNGTSVMTIAEDKIDIVTGTLTINAGVVIGDATTAVPLLPGILSPPSSKLFVSP